MDCVIHGVAKSWTRLNYFHFQMDEALCFQYATLRQGFHFKFLMDSLYFETTIMGVNLCKDEHTGVCPCFMPILTCSTQTALT